MAILKHLIISLTSFIARLWVRKYH